MSYSFNPSKTVTIDGDTLVVEDERARRTLPLRSFGVTAQQLRELLERPKSATGRQAALLDGLLRFKVVVESECAVAIDERQSRSEGYLATQIIAPRAAQQELTQQEVMILGMGGTGSIVLQHLVAAGIGHYVLADFDVVELSNLNRQFLWRSADVGASKLELARQYVTDRLEAPKVATTPLRIETGDDVAELLREHPGVTMVVSCIDTPVGIESQVVSASLAAQTPVMTGSVGVEFGHVGPLFTPPLTGCVTCWYDSSRPTRPVPRWSYGVTNSLIGVLMAKHILEFLVSPAGTRPPHRTTIEFATMQTFQTQTAQQCPHDPTRR